MKIIAILGIAALLAACGSRQVRPITTFEKTTYPEIGTTATAGVGEELITQIVGTSVGAISVPSDQKIGNFLVRKGKYSSTGQNKEYVAYAGVIIQDIEKGTEKPANLYFFHKDKGTNIACVSRKVCGALSYSADRNTNFSRAESQKTLIYSGKIGDKITLGYREFSRSMARPAFNNDVGYDLSVSSILGYQGARLEVISATNTEITYKIISDFN